MQLTDQVGGIAASTSRNGGGLEGLDAETFASLLEVFAGSLRSSGSSSEEDLSSSGSSSEEICKWIPGLKTRPEPKVSRADGMSRLRELQLMPAKRRAAGA